MFKVRFWTALIGVMLQGGLGHTTEVCASITDPKARLACYDRAHKDDATAKPQAADQASTKTPLHFAKGTKRVGNWLVKIDEDEFTNENNIVVLGAQDGGMFALRCFSGTPTLSFSVTNQTLSAGDPFTFLLRVDQKEIHNTVGDALGELSVESSMDDGLLQEMIDGNTLHVRITNSAGTSFDESFSLAKIGDALKEYRQLCPP